MKAQPADNSKWRAESRDDTHVTRCEGCGVVVLDEEGRTHVSGAYLAGFVAVAVTAKRPTGLVRVVFACPRCHDGIPRSAVSPGWPEHRARIEKRVREQCAGEDWSTDPHAAGEEQKP